MVGLCFVGRTFVNILPDTTFADTMSLVVEILFQERFHTDQLSIIGNHHSRLLCKFFLGVGGGGM